MSIKKLEHPEGHSITGIDSRDGESVELKCECGEWSNKGFYRRVGHIDSLISTHWLDKAPKVV